jgi:hypothetical protein
MLSVMREERNRKEIMNNEYALMLSKCWNIKNAARRGWG